MTASQTCHTFNGWDNFDPSAADNSADSADFDPSVEDDSVNEQDKSDPSGVKPSVDVGNVDNDPSGVEPSINVGDVDDGDWFQYQKANSRVSFSVPDVTTTISAARQKDLSKKRSYNMADHLFKETADMADTDYRLKELFLTLMRGVNAVVRCEAASLRNASMMQRKSTIESGSASIASSENGKEGSFGETSAPQLVSGLPLDNARTYQRVRPAYSPQKKKRPQPASDSSTG